MLPIEKIAKTPWYTPQVEELSALIADVVGDMPLPGISTSELMRRLQCPPTLMHSLTQHLAAVRKEYPGFVHVAKEKGAFGKPQYLWHSIHAALWAEQDRAK